MATSPVLADTRGGPDFPMLGLRLRLHGRPGHGPFPLFAMRQVEMIRTMNLNTLNVNPLLVKALNIHTPSELVSLHVEMAATRSIVTSMGFYLEQLVWASSESIEKAPP